MGSVIIGIIVGSIISAFMGLIFNLVLPKSAEDRLAEESASQELEISITR